MPDDPIVIDHYGDILWKLNRKFDKILLEKCSKMKDVDEEIIESINKKMIEGLESS